ncbi:MAG: amidohydrolase, partial [Terriglobales bacterium]
SSERAKRIAAATEAVRAKLIELRRDLHRHPELSNREERTAKVVAQRLRAIGFTDVKTGIAHHGVLATLVGGKPGPVIAVRADMDALPVTETRDVPYKSLNVGVKHACGHDAHTTIELGVAEILWNMRDQVPGTIKFIFQPAEEGVPLGETGGAKLMVAQGVLEGPKAEAIFGLHVNSAVEVGKIKYAVGPVLASADRFTLVLRGKQAHAAYPHNGIDTIVVAAEAITALQTVRSRRVDPVEPAVVTIGMIHGGTRHNIITNEVKMQGTMRTLNEDVRKLVQSSMREILDGVTKAHGATYELNFADPYPVTYNDPKLAAETLPVLEQVMGRENVQRGGPQMGAEDFAYYQQVVPGFFYWLGVGNEKKGITAGAHTPEFDIDEDSLAIGARLMANILMDYLERHSAK